MVALRPQSIQYGLQQFIQSKTSLTGFRRVHTNTDWSLCLRPCWYVTAGGAHRLQLYSCYGDWPLFVWRVVDSHRAYRTSTLYGFGNCVHYILGGLSCFTRSHLWAGSRRLTAIAYSDQKWNPVLGEMVKCCWAHWLRSHSAPRMQTVLSVYYIILHRLTEL